MRVVSLVMEGASRIGRRSRGQQFLRVVASAQHLLREHVRDIYEDPALRYFGACLALSNALTALFWYVTQPLGRILGTEPICWPFFQSCEPSWIVNASSANVVLLFLAGSSILSATLVVPRKTAPAGLVLLLAVLFVRFYIVLLDYRLVLNQHYMSLWVAVAFFVVPPRRRSLVLILVAFYFFAGTLKLNSAWLTGDALYGLRPFGMPQKWIPAACAYVVVLELFVSWGLLVQRPAIFWSALCQLVLFHASSFWVVGFYYPVLMYLLLSIVVLDRLILPEAVHSRAGRPMRTSGALSTLVFLFVACQLWPKTFPGDPAITGEGRLLALNMFDAPVRCVATLEERSATGKLELSRLTVPFLQPRIACDPLIFLQAARSACEKRSAQSSGRALRLRLEAARDGSTDYELVVNEENICRKELSYSLVKHNGWIRVGK